MSDKKPLPYKQAGVAPVFDQIDRIRQEFPKFDLADILDAFIAFSPLPAHYFLSEMRTVRKLLELLRGMNLSGVDLEELFLFLSAPVRTEDEQVASTFLYVNKSKCISDSYSLIPSLVRSSLCLKDYRVLFPFASLTPSAAVTATNSWKTRNQPINPWKCIYGSIPDFRITSRIVSELKSCLRSVVRLLIEFFHPIRNKKWADLFTFYFSNTFSQSPHFTIKQFRIYNLALLIKRVHQALQVNFICFQEEDADGLVVFTS